MSGFRMPVRSVTVFFEDGEYAGLEVELRVNVDLDFYFWALAWEDMKSADEIRDFARRWAATALVGWNLVDGGGTPVPATPEAFTGQFEPYAIGLVIGKWLEQVGRVTGPFSSASGGAATSGGRKRRASPSRRS